jgi:hypothetical protein
VLWNFWYIRFGRGDYAAAMQAAQALHQEAERSGDAGQILEARHSLWPTLSEMGQPLQAVHHMEHGLRLYVREQHAAQALVYGGHDAGACCRWHLAQNRWLLGYPEQASATLRDMMRLVEELQHPQTTGLALAYGSWVQYQRGDRGAAGEISERLVALSNAHGFRPYLGYAVVLSRVCSSEDLGIDTLRDLSRRFRELPMSRWRSIFCICLMAELYAAAGHAEDGRELMTLLGEGDRSALYAPEAFRVEGELILRSAAPDTAAAEGRFLRALEIARERAMKSFELRTAMSLARLWRDHGRRGEARDLLAPVYGWFTEGFDTADLRAAKSLLQELA